VSVQGKVRNAAPAAREDGPAAGAYSAEYYRERQRCPFLRIEVAQALQLVDPRPGERLLELGCGAGALLAAAASRGARAVGIDVNRGALRLAAGEARVLEASAEWLPFPEERFDAVVAQHLIEHFSAPGPLLQEWRRVLAPGGVLVLVTPNERYPDPSVYFDPDHKLIFSRRLLRQALIAAGFQVERCYTVFPYLGSQRLRPLARRLPWLRRLPWFGEHGAAIIVRARKARDAHSAAVAAQGGRRAPGDRRARVTAAGRRGETQ